MDDVYGINAVGGNGDPYDNDGHGTHMAGVIGAVGDNDILVTGVNWDVSIMALKALNATGSGSDANIIECMEYIIQQKRRKFLAATD
mgnify:CR=1 FL=1